MKKINNIAIEIEGLRNKECYRCRHFNNSSKNCSLTPRFIKRTRNHIPKDCPVTDKSKPVKCCNCMGDHPANFSVDALTPPPHIKYLKKVKNFIPNVLLILTILVGTKLITVLVLGANHITFTLNGVSSSLRGFYLSHA